MTISNQNIEIYRGDSETVAITLTDANNDPFVLSGSGQVKYRVSRTGTDDPAEALIAKELNNGILFDGNVAEVTLLSEDTDLEPGVYFHTLKVYDLGDVATAMIGAFIIKYSLQTADHPQQPSQLNVIVNAEVI